MSMYDVESVTQSADIFETPEVKAPPFEKDAHQAVIVSVDSGHSREKETPYVQINFVSKNAPSVEGNIKIWLPKAFEAAGFGVKFDPSVLDSGQQTSYRINVASSDKRAALQQLVFNPDSIARKAGRDPVELGLKQATTLAEYAQNLNAMLQNIEVIVLRGPRGGDDPTFANVGEAKRFLAPDVVDNKPKLLNGYQLAWQNE